jgi:hypothetical protein
MARPNWLCVRCKGLVPWKVAAQSLELSAEMIVYSLLQL